VDPGRKCRPAPPDKQLQNLAGANRRRRAMAARRNVGESVRVR